MYVNVEDFEDHGMNWIPISFVFASPSAGFSISFPLGVAFCVVGCYPGNGIPCDFHENCGS